MPSRDQLEILGPGGRITFYDLDPAKGITNIGRHPDNDIVIDGPGVAEFHAVLDHRARPYQIILLAGGEGTFVGGRIVPANIAVPLNNWETLEFDGYSLVFLADEAAEAAHQAEVEAAAIEPIEGATESMPAVAAPTGPPPPEIVLEPSAREFGVDPGQSVICRLTVINAGGQRAALALQVGGLDPAWVAISPAELNLAAGQRALVTITFSPPRDQTARAGPYLVSLVAVSPDHPNWSLTSDLSLLVQPFYEFAASELSPQNQTLAWNRPIARAAFEVNNRGNSTAVYRLTGENEQGRCRFEFVLPDETAPQPRQADLRLTPDQSARVGVRVVPFNRHLIGLGTHAYFFNVVVSPLAGGHTPRSLPGQARFRPLIGPVPIVVAVALAALLLLIGFRPAVFEFTAAPTQVSAGEEVTLRWSTSPFARLRIDPDVGAVEGPEGARSVAVTDDVIYTLTAENFMAWLSPGWFRASRQVRVLVDPVLPGIRFTVDRDVVPAGESVTLAWQVFDAEEVVLLVNGVPQVLSPSEHRGSRAFVIDRDTTYVLQARNRYTGIDGVSATLNVRLNQPGAAPAATPGGPPPVIERFDVTPIEVLPGQQVRLEWTVSGVDRVTIEPLGGSFPASGTLVETPLQTVAYVLRASNGQGSVSLVRQVTVGGLPGAPVIESFTATPSQVAPGSPEAGNITLAWTVTGNITDIQLSGPGIGTLANLPAESSRIVAVTDSSTFTLTAYNGDLVATQTAQISVVTSVPVLTAVNPPQATAGGAGMSVTVTGSNFVAGSAVQWNGSSRPTTYISSTQLSAVLSAADLAAGSTANVTVLNPPPGGGVSNSLTFTVSNPVPVIAGLTPNQVVAGGPAFNLQINGTGFNNQSVVRWNGIDRPVISASPGQLTISVTPADIATPGSVTISVFNPGPGGGSDAELLPVIAATGTPTATPSPTPTPTPTATPTVTSTP